jgi:DUF3047 family protein
MTSGLLLQALTNLALVPPGVGLPPGWRLDVPKGTEAATFQVISEHALRVETNGSAGFGSYRLQRSLEPELGVLTWRWRTATPLPGATLRDRARDDSPARVFVVFDDGRTIYYTWGNQEPVGDTFRSWTSGRRAVIVCRRANDADGSWHIERRDPFADYGGAFDRSPRSIVAVGVAADTDMLRVRSVADVGDLIWESRGRP